MTIRINHVAETLCIAIHKLAFVVSASHKMYRTYTLFYPPILEDAVYEINLVPSQMPITLIARFKFSVIEEVAVP